MTVDIIGAGIGGLTTAIALQQKGISVRIFEQAKTIKAVGAGIILANNAMQVYEKLGLKNEIEASGNPISAMNITNAQLKPISSIDLKYFEQKHMVRNIAIHRGTLQQILIRHLKEGSLHLDRALINVAFQKGKYKSTFSNGSSITSEVLLGADGLNSIVRKCLFPANKIRSARQACWRGLTNFVLPKQYQHELNEAWGKGDRIGFVQIAPEKVYWYALKSFKHSPDEYAVDMLNTYFNRYHSIIRSIIEQTPLDQIHTAEIADLSPTKVWYKRKVCLLGDAAHATTPNMGQGACQAVEDAFVLAAYLDQYTPEKAFEAFQKARLQKAHQVVNLSWTLGRLAHFSNPFLIGLRNQMMRLSPKSVSRKQSEHIFQLLRL